MRLRFLHCVVVLMIACIACGPALAQWTTYQGDARHDGYVPMSLKPAQMSMLWQRTFPTTSLNAVTAGNGEVFVSASGYFSTGMNLQALDAATGETKWSKDYGSVFSVNPPSYANGKVYIQTCNHSPGTYLWAYDANTGNQVFSAPVSAQWESYNAPTIYDGTVYVNGGYYGGMYAFDGSTGQQKWFIGTAQDDHWTPAVDANYAYAYTGRNLLAVDRITGKLAYQIAVPNNQWTNCETVTLGAYDDAIVVDEYKLICFDLKEKKIKWQTAASYGSGGQVTVANDVVYAIHGTGGGTLDAIDEISGEVLWTWGPAAGTLSGTIVATDSHLLVSTADRTYAVDLKSHSTAWSYPLGGALTLSNRALYISNSQGTLAAIAIPPSAVLPDKPAALSIEITTPTANATCAGNTPSFALSGTASELDGSGAVLATGSLASVKWTSNRGGSGIGYFDSTWNTPTAWSVSGVSLLPGDNVITVTATDLWGNSATDVITVRAPTALGVAITGPTTNATYPATTTPIALSGTATAIDAAGNVSENAGLSSVSWSNDRGGSGSGTFTAPSAAPTTWSITGVALKPGDNVITVTATDLWGYSATDVITVVAPSGLLLEIQSPTSSASYVTNATPIALSGVVSELGSSGTVTGPGNLASLKWTNSRGGNGTGTYSAAAGKPTTWSITGIGLQGGDNLITLTATDVWGNVTSSAITVTWSPGSIGAAKKLTLGALAYVDNAVVTATNVPAGSVFVEAADRSSGIRLVTNQALKIGDRVAFTGLVGRSNGEYQISAPNFLSVSGGAPLSPLYFMSSWIGNDRSEKLAYTGINATGMLIKTAGKVTGTIASQQIFYIDDGGHYQDGAGPVLGLRVRMPAGVTLPRTDRWVSVTGILRVEKITLTGWAEVNGDWYSSGTVIYVPSIWPRDASDVKVLPVTP